MTKDKTTIVCVLFAVIAVTYGLLFATVSFKAEEQDFKTFEVVTGIFGLLLTFGTVMYAYQAYQQQKNQNQFNERQLEISRYELQYSRALDLVYKQMDIIDKKISRFQGNLNNLGRYKDLSDLPLFIRDLKIVISNFHSMSFIIEQFLSRTTLHPNDKSYLYLFFSENLPPDFIVIPHRYVGHIDKMGSTIEEVRKNALSYYLKKEKINVVNSNSEYQDNSDEWFEKFILEKDENIIEEYLRDIQILANCAYGALDARKRLLDPNYKSKIFSFRKS